MGTHTPGPWAVHPDKVISRETYDTIVHFGALSDPARGHWTIETKEENQANARLIAAAPELLEVLLAQEALANLKFDGDPANAIARVRKMRRAVIEKVFAPEGIADANAAIAAALSSEGGEK